MTSSVSPQAYYPPAHALATDRSPVYVLPPATDPNIAPDLARLKAVRAAELVAHPSTSKHVFVLGTRNSKLAMVQTELVKSELESRWPGTEIRIFGMVRWSRLGSWEAELMCAGLACRLPRATTTSRNPCTCLEARVRLSLLSSRVFRC